MVLDESNKVGVLDYIVLVVILLISVFIGLYQGYKQQINKFFCRKNTTVRPVDIKDDDNTNLQTKEYLTASGSLPALPIALSLFASFFSTTALLGVPAEVYEFGIEYWLISFSCAMAPITGAFITGPFFHRLNVVSIFEYLEMRYDGSKFMRLFGMTFFLIKNLISAAIYALGPSTALSLLLGWQPSISIALICLIATFYTTIGGIKAVIWTDLFQATIMLVSLVVVLCIGVFRDVGGVDNLLATNKEIGRLNLINLDPDPFIRQSFWSLIIGGYIYFFPFYNFDQNMVQRYNAAKSKRQAQIALLLNIPAICGTLSLACFCGLMLSSYYNSIVKCDPLQSGQIQASNQYISHYVLTKLSSTPGLSGLFLGAVFCSSLSSISSSQSAMTTIIWKDFLTNNFKWFDEKKLSDKQSLTANKIIVVILGVVGAGLTYLLSFSSSNLAFLSNSLNGAFNAPLLGLFLLSCFFSCTNKTGAICGTLIGFGMSAWLAVGSFFQPPTMKLNVTIENCVLNQSMISILDPIIEPKGVDKLYTLSYMWYTAYGALITFISGLVISLLSGGLGRKVNKPTLIYDVAKFFNKKAY